MIFRGMRVCGLVALIAMAGACSLSPRNGQKLAQPWDSFNWSGYTQKPNDAIELRVTSTASPTGYATIDRATTTTTITQDGAGTKWYQYTKTAGLPFDDSKQVRALWRSDDVGAATQRKVRAQMQSYTSNSGPLASFDDNDATNTCLQNAPNGVYGMFNCSSASTPWARIEAPCGKSGQACCYDAVRSTRFACDKNLRCDTASAKCTIHAGALGEPCNGDYACNSSLTCAKGPDQCWSKVELAQVYSIELTVHTPNTADSQSASPLSVRLKNVDFYLDKFSAERGLNDRDTYGISVSDVKTLGDIKQLRFDIHGNDGWRFDEIVLKINGQQMYKYGPTSAVLIDGNSASSTFILDSKTLRSHVDWKAKGACNVPTQIKNATLTRMIEGVVGDIMAHKTGLTWGGHGNVALVKDDAYVRSRISNPKAAGLRLDMTVHFENSSLQTDVVTRNVIAYDCMEIRNCGASHNPNTGVTIYNCNMDDYGADFTLFGSKDSAGNEPGGMVLVVDPDPALKRVDVKGWLEFFNQISFDAIENTIENTDIGPLLDASAISAPFASPFGSGICMNDINTTGGDFNLPNWNLKLDEMELQATKLPRLPFAYDVYATGWVDGMSASGTPTYGAMCLQIF